MSSEVLVLPIFYKKYEYADLEYLPEAVYHAVVKYCETNSMGVGLEDIFTGEFEVRINWRKECYCRTMS